ncbi:hypothetical protein [Kribbella catacumbae]|uniref:hypothetical protein n=1 Tax=Kribbella catacumbae TaxID=460086 RepID=UPI000366E3F3|nr:hypothetical protein [Kribbella catacumbae]
MTATSSRPLRFGLIGVDSSHAPTFTRLLGDGLTGTVRGGTIVSAWKGEPAADFPPSRDRIDALSEEVAGLGVDFRPTAEEVAEHCDALLIVASDARTHPGYFDRIARYGKPVYVDTRFALTTGDARTMLATASAYGCLTLAGSPKRFADAYCVALGDHPADGIDLVGPLPIQPGHPGLAWYGVHLVELAVATLGPGCVLVDATRRPIVLTWHDGRTASLDGEQEWSAVTTGRISYPGGTRDFTIEAGPAMLTGLLESIVEACLTGRPNVPAAEVFETVAIVEAAHRSKTRGTPVIPERR